MKTLSGTALAAVAALTLSACGGQSEPETSAAAEGGELIQVNVAETAGIPSAYLSYGVEQGFFEEEGLDVTVDTSAGGAAAIPGLISKDLDLAGSNAVSALLAASKGLPISIIGPGTYGTETEGEDFSAVLVAKDSDIQEPADLEGKTIAVNTLENIGDITISAVLEEHGVDPATVDFVEIGFPEMIPALERGQIDAAWEIEPFVTIGSKSENRPVIWPYVEAHPGLMVGSYLATEEFMEQNPEVIEAFRNGLKATAESISEDPDTFREALPEISTVSPEVAEAMVLPDWKSDVDKESLQFLQDRMLAGGVISEPIDIDAVVAD